MGEGRSLVARNESGLGSFTRPNAERAGETGRPLPPPRSRENEPERREPELAVGTLDCAEGRDDADPVWPFE